MPGLHDVRTLSLHLYKRAGNDGQTIAGHAIEGMTRNIRKGTKTWCGQRSKRTWISATSPDSFAHVLRTLAHKKIQSPLSDWIF